MKRLALSAALIVASGVAAADSGDNGCSFWAQEIVNGSTDACSDLCPQAKQFDHYDYRTGLGAAFDTLQGLERFFVYLDRSSIIGAGAEAHACSVQALLLRWGDKRFAAALAKQPVRIREQAIGLLDYSVVENFQSKYPKTYRQASHE